MESPPGGPPCRARAGGMAALGPRKAAVKVGEAGRTAYPPPPISRSHSSKISTAFSGIRPGMPLSR